MNFRERKTWRIKAFFFLCFSLLEDIYKSIFTELPTTFGEMLRVLDKAERT